MERLGVRSMGLRSSRKKRNKREVSFKEAMKRGKEERGYAGGIGGRSKKGGY